MVFWISLTVLVLTVPAGPARAHKVTLFAWVEKGTVYTESKFSGGRAPKDSAVIVTDLSGNQLLEGVTDGEGRFSFPAPAEPGIKIALLAGQGHLAEWTVSAEELGAAATAPLTSSETAAAPADEIAAGDGNRHAPPADAERLVPEAGRLTIDGIRRAIGNPLAKELQALRAEVRRLRQEIDPGPSLTDVLGGIGYIIGLVGIGAYFKNRRKPSNGNRHDS